MGLVEDLLERLLELGVDRVDRLAPVLAVGVVVVRVGAHRAGPIEGADSGDVGEAGGLHQPKQGAHAAALELEDAERLAAAEQLIGLGVRVEVEVLEDDGLRRGWP